MKASIRVAMVIQGYFPFLGGAERQLAELAPFLQAQDIEVHVITRRFDGLASYERVDDVPVYRLPIPGPKPVAALAFTLTAIAQIKKIAPDVIHAYELLSPTTAAISAQRLFHIPVVVKVLRGGSLGDLANLKQKRFGEQRIASARKRVNAFIAISQEIDQELGSAGIPPERRWFIPNGVNVEHFAPVASLQKERLRERLGLPPQGLITVYSGRLAAEKRIDHLISIWPSVRASHPDALLLLLGSGREEVRLKNMAVDGVHFLGFVEDVAPYLQASDLFVLPSATEGLSNALLEALATGLPAIATAVGGAPDVIDHKRNGWLIPPDNLPALQDAVLTLLSDPACRQSLGKHGREKAIRDYSLQGTARRLKALYQHCLAEEVSS